LLEYRRVCYIFNLRGWMLPGAVSMEDWIITHAMIDAAIPYGRNFQWACACLHVIIVRVYRFGVPFIFGSGHSPFIGSARRLLVHLDGHYLFRRRGPVQTRLTDDERRGGSLVPSS